MIASDHRSTGDQRSLRCMEVWGGNEGVSDALSLPGIDTWVWSRSEGGGRGGDIYYISVCGQGRISRFALADAVGHGESASRLARRMRALMRKHIHTLDQSEMARALNRELAGRADAGEFATAILTAYFPPTDELVVCNAGHPPPLWYRARAGAWTTLEQARARTQRSAANLPLGVIPPTEYVQFAAPLAPGDVVVMYTDGIVETELAAGGGLGATGLLEIVRGLDPTAPQALAAGIREELEARRAKPGPQDDETIMVLHHNGADPPPISWGRRIRAMADMLAQAVPFRAANGE